MLGGGWPHCPNGKRRQGEKEKGAFREKVKEEKREKGNKGKKGKRANGDKKERGLTRLDVSVPCVRSMANGDWVGR